MKKSYRVKEIVMRTDEYPKGRTYFFIESDKGPNFNVNLFPKVKDNRDLAKFFCEKLNTAHKYAFNEGYDVGYASHNTFCGVKN